MLALIATGVWYGWLRRDTQAPSGELVIFHADPAPFRQPPPDQSVADVPNTGILVLEGAPSAEAEERHEVLMPPPEEPLVLDTAAEPEIARDGIADVEEAPLEGANEAVEPEPIFDAEQVTAMVAEALTGPVSQLPPFPATKPEPPEASWRPEPGNSQDSLSTQSLSFSDVAASLGGSATIRGDDSEEGRYRVRIASYSNRQTAISTWDRLHGEHNDLFQGMEALITEIVVSDKRYYRLQVGDFTTKDEAEALCAALQERAVECLVASF